MKLSERIIVRALAYTIRHGRAGQIAEVRAEFDKRQHRMSPERRQELWRMAAKRAQGNVSR